MVHGTHCLCQGSGAWPSSHHSPIGDATRKGRSSNNARRHGSSVRLSGFGSAHRPSCEKYVQSSNAVFTAKSAVQLKVIVLESMVHFPSDASCLESKKLRLSSKRSGVGKNLSLSYLFLIAGQCSGKCSTVFLHSTK